MVEDAGGTIEGIFYCPHLPEQQCNCRKPAIGLLEQIEQHFGCTLAGCYFVGDSYKDIQAAIAFQCAPVLVRTGKGLETEKYIEREKCIPVPVFDNLADAVSRLLVKKNA